LGLGGLEFESSVFREDIGCGGLEFESLGPLGLGGLKFESLVSLGDAGPKALLGFRMGQCPLGLHEVDPWSNSYPPISLSGRPMEIFMCYGEWIKLSKHIDLYMGTHRFIFFFFRRVYLGGKIFEFPPRRFRDAWLARGEVGHLMHRLVWLRFDHVLKSKRFQGLRSVSRCFSKRFFCILMPVSSVFDANASHSFQLPIKPRSDSYFGLTCPCD
jgi:hypothetical protein